MGQSKHIAITGAAGHLGSHLCAALVDRGFTVTGVDFAESAAPLPEAVRFVVANLNAPDAYREALSDADVVVHCASIHPWKEYEDNQYLDCNIKGTWTLYGTLADIGIDKVVLTSSISATAYQGIMPADWPVTEDRSFPLEDLYSLTKRTQEDIARRFASTGKIRTIALRPPAFMPKSDLQTGFGLTGMLAQVEDMVSAHMAAVRVMAGKQTPPESLGPFEAFFTTNRVPYTAADAELLGADGNMVGLVRKYWPDACDWLEERGYTGGWLPAVYDLSKAKRLLNWEPTHNFDQWWARHASE
jgi:nucleoside-diphosphate-sugar epimerase